MAGLGDTTAMLRRLNRQQSGGSSGPGRLAEHAGFGANPGALRMWLYAPDGATADAPIVVVLHGCGQGAAEFASQSGWMSLADRLGFAVLAPEQTSTNNPNRCFNWFQSGDIRRGRGEVASIAQMIGFARRELRLGRGGVFVTGLSAGGAMASAMLATYPELFLGGAILAGLPYGVAEGTPEALRAMSWPEGRDGAHLADLVRTAAPATAGGLPKLSIWHGEADPIVNPANAADLARQWAGAGQLRPDPGATTTTGRRTRSVWRDSDGAVKLEVNLIAGLGHGVPLSTRGEDSLGQAAPYMLEAGISSSEEIARFWGLEPGVEPRRASQAEVSEPRPRPQARPQAQPQAAEAGRVPEGTAAHVLQGLKAHIPPEVSEVIAKAFRAAGLMS